MKSLIWASKSTLMEEKVRYYLTTLYNDYQTGRIATLNELREKFVRTMRDYYESLGQPVFKLREVSGSPIAGDYNAMMREAKGDLDILFTQGQNLGKALEQEFKYTDTERRLLSGMNKKLSDRIAVLTKKLEATQGEQIWKESFINEEYFDKGMVRGTAAEVNKDACALVLPRLDVSKASGLSVKVLDTNGLPGNTHQVKPSGQGYKFCGQEGINSNMGAMLDGNADTWFEVEIYRVDEETMDSVDYLGFSYKEGNKWTTDLELLYFKIQITLATPQDINWINILPFVPPEKGVSAPYLTGIKVDDGQGNHNMVASNQMLSDLAIIFPKQKVKTATIEFQQIVPYTVTAGHFAYWSKDLASGLVYGVSDVIGDRVEGPLPSVSDLGLSYDPKTQSINWPDATGETTTDETALKSKLFTMPTEDGKEALFEGVTAERFFIGIRDIGLSCSRFDKKATYISKPIKHDNVQSIILYTDQYIPDIYGDGEWLSYSVSLDDGKTWVKIDPTGSVKAGAIEELILNANMPQDMREDNKAYLDVLANVNELRLKIEISRPDVSATLSDADYYTPMLYEAELRIG